MDITKMTLAEFLRLGAQRILPADPNAFFPLAGVVTEQLGAPIQDLNQSYALHQLQTDAGDVAVTIDGEPVGFYFGELLAVHPEHQRKGIGVAMVLEAVKHREAPTHRKMSMPGLLTLSKAWELANAGRG